MKQLFYFIAAMLLLCSTCLAQSQTQRTRLEKHVYTLASDSLQGRRAGSPDAEKARQYIEREWLDMGLKPLWDGTFRSAFKLFGQPGYCNLVGLIEGSDPVLKQEYIIVGGHYDHLGVQNDQVYNGADDNASGTACVTEIARQLLARQSELKRSVIICAFDAEEIGLHGSSFLANTLKTKGIIDRVKLMMSVDMVGWLKQGGALELQGTGTLADGDNLTSPKSLGIDIPIRTKRFENSIFTATDTEPFAKKGIPTLAITTGIKSPYHKPEDDANLIDYDGLDRVTDYLAAFTLRLASTEGDLGSGNVAEKHRTKVPLLEAGLQVGYNSSWLQFPNAAFNGKSLSGLHGGLALQLNLGNTFSVHADLIYSLFRTPLPDIEQPFVSAFRMRQQAVLLPLTLQLNISNVSNRFFFNFGGYAAYLTAHDVYKPNTIDSPAVMKADLSYPAELGIAWGVGFRLGYHYEFRLYNLHALTPVYLSGVSAEPQYKSFPNHSTLSLAYYF